jgi:methylase of polypeptide subunit release factors
VAVATADSAIGHVRELLQRAGYAQAGIRAAGVDPGLGVRRPDVPVLLRALSPVEPLASLVRLFLLNQHLDRSEAGRHLGRHLAHLVEAGLVAQRDDRIEPTVQLTPWRNLIVVHDPDPEGELWPEHVSGPTPAAETIAALLVPGNVDTALDMGTGSGLLALLLAGRARSVLATDVNAVALRYTELGAKLNELPNVEVRSGSLFEPVGDTRLDRIMSNPPFVISPDRSLVFRHSSLARDELSRRVVEGAADHLADGGVAAILCNWIVPRGTSWLDAIRPWLDSRGCDAIVLLHGVEDPISYAVRWNGRAQYVAPLEFPQILDRWLEYDRQESIEAIASGAVILRRRTGRNWTHGLELDAEPRGPGGQQLVDLFAAMDYLHGSDPGDILRGAFRLGAAHRLEQTLASREGEYVVEPATLVLDEGLGTKVTVAPELIPVVLRLDGSQVLDDIVDEVATGTGADRADLATRAVALVRGMLERGVLQPPASVP